MHLLKSQKKIQNNAKVHLHFIYYKTKIKNKKYIKNIKTG